jgi:hypothetical protein
VTATSVLPVRVWKEFRALSPAWLAALASIALAALLDDRVRALGLAAYVLGTVALGALSMGHEYNGRTLNLMLSQPTRRQRLMLEKSGVLAVMLLVLCAVAWFGLFDPTVQWGGSISSARNRWVLVFALPLLCGLFVAPWLTMLCRNAMAGVVFAVAVPATIWVASDLASALTYGGELSTTVEARDFAFEMFWRGTVILCAIAAAAGWWMFLRLEAIESRGLEVHLPVWLVRRAQGVAAIERFASRRPIWLLVRKELRLQQLTFAVSGLYIVGWFGISLFRESFPQHQITLLLGATACHGCAIVLLAGALPSAEERQLGTLEWQVLLPMAAWKQWAVKVAVALSVAMVLALGLPTLISLLSSSPDLRRELRAYHSPVLALAVVMATTGSLYVSSLSANGLRALLVSLPAVLGVMGFATQWVVGRVYGQFGVSRGLDFVFTPGRYPSLFGAREMVLSALLVVLLIVFYAGVLALLLRFAMVNHRSTERGAKRVWTQLSWMAGSLMVGALLWTGVFASYSEGVRQLRVAAYRQWVASRFSAEFVIEGWGDTSKQEAVVIVFSERLDTRRPLSFHVLTADSKGRFSTGYYLPPDLQYSAAAVAKPGLSATTLERDLRSKPELRDRIRASAATLTLRPGESTTVTLTLTQVP